MPRTRRPDLGEVFRSYCGPRLGGVWLQARSGNAGRDGYLPRDPVIGIPGPLRDFAITLSDGRRVVGHERDGEWSIYVYAGDSDGRLLGYGIARTRPHALEHAGLSGEDAGEVLGRAGI